MDVAGRGGVHRPDHLQRRVEAALVQLCGLCPIQHGAAEGVMRLDRRAAVVAERDMGGDDEIDGLGQGARGIPHDKVVGQVVSDRRHRSITSCP